MGRSWEKNNKAVPNTQDIINERANFNWFSNDKNQKHLLKSIVGSITSNGEVEILFQGGEPFIGRHVFEFIDRISKNLRPKIKISFVTNATVVPQNVRTILEGFKQVAISIEGCGKVNNYIRWPSKYEDIENNIKISK